MRFIIFSGLLFFSNLSWATISIKNIYTAGDFASTCGEVFERHDEVVEQLSSATDPSIQEMELIEKQQLDYMECRLYLQGTIDGLTVGAAKGHDIGWKSFWELSYEKLQDGDVLESAYSIIQSYDEVFNKKIVEGAIPGFCTNVGFKQLGSAVYRYIKKHPEVKSRRSAGVIYESLSESYPPPCER